MLDRDPGSRWTMADAGHTLRRLAEAHRPDATLAQTRESTKASAPAPAPVPAFAPEPEPGPNEQDEHDEATTGFAATPPVERVEEVAPAPAPSPTRGRGPRRRRRAVLVALALLLVAGGIALALTQLDLGGSPSNASEASPKDSTKTGSASGNKDSTKSDAPQSTGETSSSAKGSSKEAFIRDYYDKAPGGSEEAWSMLAPAMQSMGRDRYLGFWRTIESVEVRDVQVGSGGNDVEVTLVYTSTNGKTSTEHKRETLSKADDGSYQIEADVPAG
jgi:hypothetical protein